jgi:hypothetical protein
MLTVKGKLLELSMKENGTGVIIKDTLKDIRWYLDESTRFAARDVIRFCEDIYSKVSLLGQGEAKKVNENTIVSSHSTKAGRISLRWVMEEDRLRIFAEAGHEDSVTAFSLPGTFRPAEGETFVSAIPISQGILHNGKGPSFYKNLPLAGHSNLSMAMFGQSVKKGSLVTIAETESDATLVWEKTKEGKVNLFWLQYPSMGKLAYTRETVIFFAGPDLTSICKTYRKYEIEKGRFKTWEEKISERPVLKKLFGAAVVYMGYHGDTELDYTACLKKLKACGIDRAYVYPVLMKTTQPFVFKNGSRKINAIDIRKHLSLIHKLGYTAGSFILITEGPKGKGKNSKKGLKFTPEGDLVFHWGMRGRTWYGYSLWKRLAAARNMIDREHRGFDGVHYDVLCSRPLEEDYSKVNRTDAHEDFLNRKEIMSYAADRNMLVSAEGFRDRLTPYYDLGNSKIAHVAGRDEYCVVPMTMLVYHDSAYQTWWEVDNYNNPEHRSQFSRGYNRNFYWGGGFVRIQSAMDALYGTPPDIFPFGLQYNFVPHNHPNIYFYKNRIEDESVREAVEYAKPVMKLNKRIGKLEMTELKLHRPDGTVQETVFSDGTRVIANFANVALEVPGTGVIPPESWKVK